ncbi:MAG: alpha-amylase family glycosyl hydrolase [Ruminococcus sp.]
MKRKIMSLLLILCMAFSCLCVGEASVQSATTDKVQSETEAYGLADNVQQGQILQCWNWSYNSIKNNMKKIAEQGFSAIQTSPVQAIKEDVSSRTMNDWWLLYQPTYFDFDSNGYNGLGTKAEFTAMCEEAHKYGVKVLVDAVLNHMANISGNDISTEVDSDLRNDSDCWHDITQNSTYNTRTDITQYCMNGLPDLNTANSTVQSKATAFLEECIDCGADGFRLDAAKHIETPVDADIASNYWPNVLNAVTSYASSTRGITPYYYGEILNEVSGSDDSSVAAKVLSSYESYMSVTVNTLSNDVCTKINDGNASGAARTDYYYLDSVQASAKNAVLWNESHDTYADGTTSGRSTEVMNKTWAVVGTRYGANAMYFARPNSLSTSMGTADATGWTNPEVKAVNQFKNYYADESESLSSSGSIVYNERGTDGVVIVNCGGTSTSVSLTAKKMASGTYVDQITGNTFTVSGGKISGTIGSTGIAVVYNANPQPYITPGSTSYTTDSLTLTLKYRNASSGQYSVNNGSYTTFTNGDTITIGSGLAYGTVTTVKVKATDGTTTSDEVTYTYTKTDPSQKPTLYFDNSSYNWSNVYVYVYNSDGTKNASWPGVKMELDSTTGYYYYELPDEFVDGYAMFTESSDATDNRYPGKDEPGLAIGGTSKLFSANNTWSDYTPPTPTTAPTTAVPTTSQPVSTQPAGTVLSNVKIMFKGTSLSYLKPEMTLTDSAGTSTEYQMAKGDYIGTYINGAYQFYWYEATIPSVTAGNSYKITFKTAGSNMDASMNLDFVTCPTDNKMYFGVDNLQIGTKLEDLTYNETAKSCFRSSVNMFTNVAGGSYDPTLTLASVNVTSASSDNETVTYNLGDSDMNKSLNVRDVTKTQMILANAVEATSDEELLADFDVSGSADVKDVTYLQMYLAKI